MQITTFNIFKNSKVLVTGGTGLIGRSVIEILCDHGAEVTTVYLDDIIVDTERSICNLI